MALGTTWGQLECAPGEVRSGGSPGGAKSGAMAPGLGAGQNLVTPAPPTLRFLSHSRRPVRDRQHKLPHGTGSAKYPSPSPACASQNDLPNDVKQYLDKRKRGRARRCRTLRVREGGR